MGHSSISCDRHGLVDGRQRFYSGKTRRSVFMVSAGAIHRLTRTVVLFEGVGYADTRLDWQLASSEGGGFARNTYYSCKGITGEAGVMVRIRRVALSATVSTIKGKEWFGTVGIGLRFGKDLKKTSSPQ